MAHRVLIDFIWFASFFRFFLVLLPLLAHRKYTQIRNYTFYLKKKGCIFSLYRSRIYFKIYLFIRNLELSVGVGVLKLDGGLYTQG